MNVEHDVDGEKAATAAFRAALNDLRCRLRTAVLLYVYTWVTAGREWAPVNRLRVPFDFAGSAPTRNDLTEAAVDLGRAGLLVIGYGDDGASIAAMTAQGMSEAEWLIAAPTRSTALLAPVSTVTRHRAPTPPRLDAALRQWPV